MSHPYGAIYYYFYFMSAVIPLMAARKMEGGEQDGRSALKPAGRLDCSFVPFTMESHGATTEELQDPMS